MRVIVFCQDNIRLGVAHVASVPEANKNNDGYFTEKKEENNRGNKREDMVSLRIQLQDSMKMVSVDLRKEDKGKRMILSNNVMVALSTTVQCYAVKFFVRFSTTDIS